MSCKSQSPSKSEEICELINIEQVALPYDLLQPVLEVLLSYLWRNPLFAYSVKVSALHTDL